MAAKVEITKFWPDNKVLGVTTALLLHAFYYYYFSTI